MGIPRCTMNATEDGPITTNEPVYYSATSQSMRNDDERPFRVRIPLLSRVYKDLRKVSG